MSKNVILQPQPIVGKEKHYLGYTKYAPSEYPGLRVYVKPNLV
jgi:hypothetical protein